MRVSFISLGLCCLCAVLQAQTAPLDLQKILDPFTTAKYLYFENQYLYFEEGNPTPIQTEEGVFIRNGEKEYARMGALEVLKTERLMVAADHEDRLVSAQIKTTPVSMNDLIDTERIKELLQSRLGKIQYVFGKTPWSAISLTDPERPQETIVVHYDPAGWIIKEISITAKDPDTNPWDKMVKYATVVIRYSHYSTFPRPFPYKTDDYIKKKGKQFKATGKCKGYHVM